MPASTNFENAETKAVALAAQIKALHPSLRDPTEAELELLTEAKKAGAVIVPRLFREYLAGEIDALPAQWEGTYLYAEDALDAEARERVDHARDTRDYFLRRCDPGGDLHHLVLAIQPQARRAA